MVLMHKLRRMEELDLANMQESESPPLPTPTDEIDDSASMRPRTRSQSGQTSKKRTIGQEPLTSAPKKARTKKAGRAAKVAEETDNEKETKSSYSDTPRPVRFASPTSTTDYASGSRPGPRSRVAIPIPVSGLTKKSRGRRVPIMELKEREEMRERGELSARTAPGSPSKRGEMGKMAAPRDKDRTYVCLVPDCGKTFHRGEHLKRHIRSIHTHEKPFKCTVPSCAKNFNRHDNLLQHLKVHEAAEKHNNADSSSSSSDSGQSKAPAAPVIPLIPSYILYNASFLQTGEPYMQISQLSNSTSSQNQTERPMASLTSFVDSNHNTLTAVSSLRTELPASGSIKMWTPIRTTGSEALKHNARRAAKAAV
ncbi:hypothetical protein C8J56DRAFT_860283 [Mycena floridula]|nr:hypothetical protein C8J56DRAFT_860283 [Mycena floridula]